MPLTASLDKPWTKGFIVWLLGSMAGLVAIWAAGLPPAVTVACLVGVILLAALCGLLLVMTSHARRLEAAMADARRQHATAQAANRAKSEFMSRMSHELRTPLNAVLGFAQLMDMDEREPLPPLQRRRIGQIQQAGWHLLDLIDDVLDISRIDGGTLRLKVEPVHIGEEVARCLQAVADEARRQEVVLAHAPEVPGNWGVMADSARFRQILMQLLGNAIKFNRPGGGVEVTVSVTRRPGLPTASARIGVRDTGLGMSEAQLAQLFQPFNRLGREHGSTTGTGIGLVLSQQLAASMNGEIDVQSREDEGSTFTLVLPAVDLPKATASRHATTGRARGDGHAAAESAGAMESAMEGVTERPMGDVTAGLAGGAIAVPLPEGHIASAVMLEPAGSRDGAGRAPTSGGAPAARGAAGQPGATSTAMPRPRHVLYVEDNAANSEVIRSALAARPWITVSLAPTTEEGLAVLHDRLRGSQPDLILLDVHLPDASGQELLRLIKANPDTTAIPVIMISADAMPEQIDAALSAGASCYLTKPVQLAELLRQMDELMPA